MAIPCEPLAFEMVATAWFEDDHVTEVVRSRCELSEKVPVAVNATVRPAGIDGLTGVNAIDTNVGVGVGVGVNVAVGVGVNVAVAVGVGVNVAVVVGVGVGEGVTGTIVRLAVSVAVENAVLPPLVEVFAKSPLPPAEV